MPSKQLGRLLGLPAGHRDTCALEPALQTHTSGTFDSTGVTALPHLQECCSSAPQVTVWQWIVRSFIILEIAAANYSNWIVCRVLVYCRCTSMPNSLIRLPQKAMFHPDLSSKSKMLQSSAWTCLKYTCRVELSLGELPAHLWLLVTTKYPAAARMRDEGLAYLQQSQFTPGGKDCLLCFDWHKQGKLSLCSVAMSCICYCLLLKLHCSSRSVHLTHGQRWVMSYTCPAEALHSCMVTS